MEYIKELAKKPLYTINDAAQVLCIPTEQIVDLVETGIIPAFGNAQLIRSADIIQFICPPDLQTLSYPTHQLVDILDEMLLVKKGGIEGSTMEEYINTSKRIRDEFAAISIQTIKPKDIELFFQGLKNKLTGQKLSYHTLKRTRKLICMLFDYAYLNGYLEKPFPMKKVKIRGYKTNKDSRFLSEETIAALLYALKDNPRYYVLCRLLVATGLRIGEALALQFSDFDRKKECCMLHERLKKVRFCRNIFVHAKSLLICQSQHVVYGISHYPMKLLI